MIARFFILLVFVFSTTLAVRAQVLTPQDTIIAEEETQSKVPVRKRNKNAMRATIMSAVLPGLGQVYNRKYWKVPIIYALGGVLAYWAVENNGYYQAFKQAYADTVFLQNNKGSTAVAPLKGRSYKEYENLGAYTPARLQNARDQSLRNFQLNIIGMVGVYVLNIIDATVDAHLKNFNVNENLEARVKPNFNIQPLTGMEVGMNVTFLFKN